MRDLTDFMCNMTHDPFLCVPSLIFMYLTGIIPICVTRLISMCDMTHFMCDMTHFMCDMTHFMCDMTHFMCDMTHFMCDMTHHYA